MFDRKVEEKQDAVKEKREKELIELEERSIMNTLWREIFKWKYLRGFQ